MSAREAWVPVKSETEVEAGMTLRFQHEGEKTAIDTVLAVVEAHPGGDGCTSWLGFRLARFPEGSLFCIQCALRKGDVIHRLEVPPDANLAVTATPKTLEVVGR